MRHEFMLTKPNCLGIGFTVAILALTGLLTSLFILWSLSCLGGSALGIAVQQCV